MSAMGRGERNSREVRMYIASRRRQWQLGNDRDVCIEPDWPGTYFIVQVDAHTHRAEAMRRRR